MKPQRPNKPLPRHTTPSTPQLLAALRQRCKSLPGSEEYIMVHHPAFRVGKKPFAIVGFEEATRGATLSINLGRDAQDALLSDTRFSRTPYIGQHGWVTVAYADLSEEELHTLVLDSWRRVASKRQLNEQSSSAQGRTPPAKKRRAAR